MQPHIQLDTREYVGVEGLGQGNVLAHSLRCIQQPVHLPLGGKAIARCKGPVEVVRRRHRHGLPQQHIRQRKAFGYPVDKRLVKEHQALAAGRGHNVLQQIG